LRDQVRQHRARDAAPQMRGRRPHRLDLTMRRVELLERAHTQQRVALPGGPHGHFGPAQSAQIKRKHRFGWRIIIRLAQVQFGEGDHRLSRHIVPLEPDREFRQGTASLGSTPHRWIAST
jgi:hypothetical protein